MPDSRVHVVIQMIPVAMFDKSSHFQKTIHIFWRLTAETRMNLFTSVSIVYLFSLHMVILNSTTDVGFSIVLAGLVNYLFVNISVLSTKLGHVKLFFKESTNNKRIRRNRRFQSLSFYNLKRTG